MTPGPAHRFRRTLAPLLVIALAALPGCGEHSPDERKADAPRSRVIAATQWDTLWVRGGSESDSLLLIPRTIAATENRVYILDAGAGRVVALRALDGALEWVSGRKGGGPGEYRNAASMTLTPGGNVLVTDPQNLRMTELGQDGRVVREIPLRDIGYVQSVCPLRDGTFLMAALEGERPLVRIDADGRVVSRHPLPWPDLADAPPLARQAVLAPTPDREACVLGLVMGRGFAVFREGRFGEPGRYVEWFDLPEVQTTRTTSDRRKTEESRIARRRIAATDMAAEAGDVFVSFEGESTDAGRLIDRYDLRTGSYRESYLFRGGAPKIARLGRGFLILHHANGYPTLAAVVPRPAARAAAARP